MRHHHVDVGPLGRLIGLDLIAQQLARVTRNQEDTMAALDDLRAVDADLAAAVTDLSGAVDRIDADFTALEQKIADGVDPADIQAEVDNLRATVDAAKQTKANIDTADPQAPAPTT